MVYRPGARETIELLEGLKTQQEKTTETWNVELEYRNTIFDVDVELPKGSTDLEIENEAKDKLSSEFIIHTKEKKE